MMMISFLQYRPNSYLSPMRADVTITPTWLIKIRSVIFVKIVFPCKEQNIDFYKLILCNYSNALHFPA